jgi:hypothetical protein
MPPCALAQARAITYLYPTLAPVYNSFRPYSERSYANFFLNTLQYYLLELAGSECCEQRCLATVLADSSRTRLPSWRELV